jgi:hypothetical protein
MAAHGAPALEGLPMTVIDAKPVTPLDRINDPPLLHIVLKDEWPAALCGATVRERFTDRASGLDRCTRCLELARQRRLFGRPAWV